MAQNAATGAYVPYRSSQMREIDLIDEPGRLSQSPEPLDSWREPSAASSYLPAQARIPRRPISQTAASRHSYVPLVPDHAEVPRSLPPSNGYGRRNTRILEEAGLMDATSMPPAADPQASHGYGVPVWASGGVILEDLSDNGPYPSHPRAIGNRIAALEPDVAYDGGRYMEEKDIDMHDTHSKMGSKAWRKKWLVVLIIASIILVAGIIGGVVGGVLSARKSSGTRSSGNTTNNGLYDINSPQVKALLNNKNLHRVFPGMDYTPLNAQYPACLTTPPDQNNVTLDMAVLSQLTPAVRLYGTDCNQTEMVLTAINQLGYNSTLKVWLGVWLQADTATNTRQLQQMYDILDKYPSSHFAGIIVGNEVLFRKDLTEPALAQHLRDVRGNLTAKNIHLPVATSDLGDDWTSALAKASDIVMSNVHPFFAGVTPDQASAWAYQFWQSNDVVLTAGSGNTTAGWSSQIISEIGWPSAGGNDCGVDNLCANGTAGAVASVANMNTFMKGWVCPSMSNGTTYFWFEAFDEPWKSIYNTATDNWETKWGLFDADRNLKSGLSIPDCGGKTLSAPY